MTKKIIRLNLAAALVAISLWPACAANSTLIPESTPQPLFVCDQDGYHTYRIPALTVTTNLSLIHI